MEFWQLPKDKRKDITGEVNLLKRDISSIHEEASTFQNNLDSCLAELEEKNKRLTYLLTTYNIK